MNAALPSSIILHSEGTGFVGSFDVECGSWWVLGLVHFVGEGVNCRPGLACGRVIPGPDGFGSLAMVCHDVVGEEVDVTVFFTGYLDECLFFWGIVAQL